MRLASVHGGFTLVEVVVVIGIIIVLAALTISVGVVVVEGSEVRQTETVLRQLETALQEWQTHADRRVTWGENDTPQGAVYDMQIETGTESPVFLVTELLNTIARSSNIQNIVARIDPDFVHTYRFEKYPEWIESADESEMDSMWAVNAGADSLGLAVLDAWGQPFRIAHPGCVDGSVGCVTITTGAVDADGTVRTGIEYEYGIAKNRQILFVSAGPDGKFGDLNATDADLLAQTKDNIYSYRPAMP